jgi:hypothetical protein
MAIGAITERFDFGRVVGRTFGLIGRNFMMFAFVSLIMVGAPEFGLLALQGYMFGADYNAALPAIASVNAIGGIVTLVLSYALIGVLTRASIDDLSGKGARLGPALADGLRYFFFLFLVAVLTGIGVVLGLILLVIPGIYLAVRWMVAAPALVAEGLGPTSAMGRSGELIRGHWWWSFALVLLYFVFAVAVEAALSFVAGFGNVAADYLVDLSPWSLAYAGGAAIASSLTTMLSAVGTAALYFELRQVKEGVGVDQIASVFD